MPTSSTSLVVRVSADLNDFTKQLDKATRDVDKAANKIASFGKALTVGITLPVAAAAAALAKMAAENEDTAGRMERVFGKAASSVNASIQTMMKSVPEANTELQKMAISAQNMNLGLGLAPQKAAQVSDAMLKLAGDAAAFAHVPMADALDALERGLAGKTKGLLQFGIAITEADIKQRALSMGLLHQGNELTETGTALAAYSLIMEKSSRIQGEAARTADQAGKSFAFLKRDLSELADNVSGLVLPSLSALANKAREVVGIFAGLDQSSVKTFFTIAAGAALIGPVIVGLVKLVDVVFKVRAAFTLLAAGGTIAGFFGSLAAIPFATIVAGIAAITVAVGALVVAYQKLKGAKPSDLTGPLNNDPTLNKALGISGTPAPALTGTNAPTERAPAVDAMKELQDRAQNIAQIFKQIGEGAEINGAMRAYVLTLAQIDTALSKITDQTSKQATALREARDNLQGIVGEVMLRQLNISNLPGAGQIGNPAQPLRTGLAVPDAKVAQIGQEFSDSALAAAIALQKQDYAILSVNVEYATLRQTLEQFGISLGNVSVRAQVAMNIAANAAFNFAQQLVAGVGGKGPAANTGRGIGGLIGAIGGAFIPGLGPFVGSTIGGIAGTAVGGLIGGLFDHPKKAADTAATAMDTLAKTVDRVTASITNVPAFFKVQNYRFEAAPVQYRLPSTPTPTNPIPPGTTIPGSPIPQTPGGPDPNDPKGGSKGNLIVQGDIHVYGITDVKSFMAELSYQNLKNKGTGNASRLSFANGI